MYPVLLYRDVSVARRASEHDGARVILALDFMYSYERNAEFLDLFGHEYQFIWPLRLHWDSNMHGQHLVDLLPLELACAKLYAAWSGVNRSSVPVADIYYVVHRIGRLRTSVINQLTLEQPFNKVVVLPGKFL